MMSNHNRDINRQNKATSVIDASIYSLISQDKLKTLLEICKSVASDKNNTLSDNSKQQLEYATSALDTKKEDDSLVISSHNYMKCSTYVLSWPVINMLEGYVLY